MEVELKQALEQIEILKNENSKLQAEKLKMEYELKQSLKQQIKTLNEEIKRIKNRNQVIY